jgi:glycerophosphoryl diester phosphodiesterase
VSRPAIVGHRGAAGHAPENTLPSFRKALELGAAAIETDVRLTRDGMLVCFHDDRLDRVTPESGRIDAWEWDALARVPVLPGAFGGRYPATIPSLAAVVRELPASCRLIVELKAEAERPDRLVVETLEALQPAAGRFRLISFEADLLRLARVIGGDAIPLGVLTGARDAGRLLPLARELQAEAVHPHFRSVTAELSQTAHREGFLLNAWTVNSSVEAKALAAFGPDEITTDYPDLIAAAV